MRGVDADSGFTVFPRIPLRQLQEPSGDARPAHRYIVQTAPVAAVGIIAGGGLGGGLIKVGQLANGEEFRKVLKQESREVLRGENDWPFKQPHEARVAGETALDPIRFDGHASNSGVDFLLREFCVVIHDRRVHLPGRVALFRAGLVADAPVLVHSHEPAVELKVGLGVIGPDGPGCFIR